MQFTLSYGNGSNYTVGVERTSSPLQGAPAGALSTGSAIYYGDVLQVSYAASSGYSIASSGPASITVTGNVDSGLIYATAAGQNITYSVVYQSSNGTSLGSSSATYAYGTTNIVSPPGYSGYATPAAQTVPWDITNPKTIYFTYTPNGVGAQYLCNNKWWWNHEGKNKGITTTIYVNYSNRTANSVKVNVTWVQTISAYYYFGYTQTVKVSVGNGSGENSIASSVWASDTSSQRTETRTMSFNVSGLSATQTSVSYSVNCSCAADDPGSWSGNITIPAY